MSRRSRSKTRQSDSSNKMTGYLKKIQFKKKEMNAPPSKKRKVDYSSFNKKVILETMPV